MGIARHGKYEDDLPRLLAKVAALKAFLETEDGANLLIAYRRARTSSGSRNGDNIQYGRNSISPSSRSRKRGASQG